jgi:hypothetical protein
MFMRTTRSFGYFGKGAMVSAPPAPPQVIYVNAPGQAAPMPVQVPAGTSDAELSQLKADIVALRAQLAAGMPVQTPSGPVNLPPNASQAQLVAAGALTLPGVATRGGEVVQGSGGQTQRELTTQAGQTFFTRSSDAPDANLRWDDWRRLAAMLPPNFNEAKYLAKNPDVAEAVRIKAMPSGAWHYVMYGMKGCQAGEKAGKTCDIRALEGWRHGLSGYRKPMRRPGYLSGFSPWK